MVRAGIFRGGGGSGSSKRQVRGNFTSGGGIKPLPPGSATGGWAHIATATVIDKLICAQFHVTK